MVLHILWSFNINGALEANAGGKGLAILGDLLLLGDFGEFNSAWQFGVTYYQNNPFLGMVQMKYCLKTFKTCLIIIERLSNVSGGG